MLDQVACLVQSHIWEFNDMWKNEDIKVLYKDILQYNVIDIYLYNSQSLYTKLIDAHRD